MSELSHIDSTGKPQMVDVGNKKVTNRTAKAQARILLPPEVISHFSGKDIESKKGPVFQTAIIAGISGAKKTSELIPLCHPLPLNDCSIDIHMAKDGLVTITAEAKVEARTGVEMEALTAATVAALTVYDMCKALSHDIVIKEIRLLSKTGGKKDIDHEDRVV
jgi:cyclic pyranopterin phosphate synthase